MAINKPKTFADCSIYGKVDEAGFSTERALVSFIMSADRIDISSNAFKGVVEQLKSRAQVAVIVRMLQQGNVVLGISNKELSPSMKVFYAKDIKAGGKSKKVFVDVTNIITLENGFFVCKNIDRFAAYLLGVMIMLIYYNEPQKYLTNGSLQKYSTTAFIKLYCAIINDLRMPGYITNKAKVQYIVGVYFANSVLGLELQQARNTAANCLGINKQEASALDFYYSTDDLKNIYTFTDSLIKTFKLKDLSTDGLINKWIYAYGKGTMYALELYPAFLTLVMYAYSGSYINNMKRIENVLSKELVEIANIVLRIGNDTFSKGFKHESADSRMKHEKKFHELMEAHNIPMSILSEKEDSIDPEEISKEGLKSEQEDQGPKTPEEANTLVDELKKDSPMTERTETLQEFNKDVKAYYKCRDAMEKDSGFHNNPTSYGDKEDLNNLRDKGSDGLYGFDDAVRNKEDKEARDRNSDDLIKNLDSEISYRDAKRAERKATNYDGLERKRKLMDLYNKHNKRSFKNESSDLDPEEISKEGLKSEQEDQGPKTPEEANTLVDELKKDSPMTERTETLQEFNKDVKAYYKERELLDKHSHLHDKTIDDQELRKDNDILRDKGSLAKFYNTPTTTKAIKDYRDDQSDKTANTSDEFINYYNRRRQRRKEQLANESTDEETVNTEFLEEFKKNYDLTDEDIKTLYLNNFFNEGTDDLDAEAISKDAVKSEDDKLPATNGETKSLEDDIVEDVVLK